MGATKFQKNEDQASSKDIAQFQMGVGEANWVTTGTRLDIAFSTSNLNKYISNPLLRHFQTLK